MDDTSTGEGPSTGDVHAVPLVVIGGYLGSGKTTLVNHLLRQAAGRRIAVLVNDFGAVSIDADLIVGASDGVLALAGGCVCCSFGEDLIGTLQRAARRVPQPDVILLECSGVGLPAAVARSAALSVDVQVEGVVVLVDAAQVRQQATDRYVGDTVCAQLGQADLLILNQLDRCPAPERPRLRDWLAGHAAGAPQIDCEHGRVQPELVLGLRALPARDSGRWPGTGGLYRPTTHALPHRLRHVRRQVGEPVELLPWAQQLVTSSGGRLLRAKGIVRGLDGQWWSVQVMGKRVEVAARAGDGGAHAGTVVSIEALPDGGAAVQAGLP